MTEDFKAFKIPETKREEYFAIVEKAYDLFPKSMKLCPMDCYSDPIVKFTEWTAMGKNAQMWWTLKLKQIGAKDVSEIYADE